jgi:hypothetical protein
MTKRTVRVLVGLVVATACLSLSLSAGAAGDGSGKKLSKRDHAAIADARARGQQQIGLMIAAKPGANALVASGINALGGTIRYQDDSVDYLRALVPIDKADQAAGLDGVQAANVDRLIPIGDPSTEGAGVDGGPPSPPDKNTPALNPYLPTRDIGAPQFVANNPTFDGRGVVVGMLDTGVDLFTPELQSAKALDGTPVRKFVDWVTMTDPVTDGDPMWIDMKNKVTVVGGSFTFDNVTYTDVGADGVYRFGIFDEGVLPPPNDYQQGSQCNADVNRNRICNEKFGVLWRESDSMVWVDSNADHSFAGEPGMTNYKVNHDVAAFGKDDPNTAPRDTVPFVVQIDKQDRFVNIGIVSGSHGTHVAGIIAGKSFFGGAMNGAAPEAQLVSVRVCLFAGCTAHGLIEGMIYAARKSNVDVINMSIGGLPALNDGRGVFDTLYNRLIEGTKAQMFISAGNDGPGVNTVANPSDATKVMSIGAYVSKATFRSNYNSHVPKVNGLFWFSARGPREDGGFKPQIVAPGAAISTIPGWLEGAPVPGTYDLPPGYGMFNGTSMAAPEATGGAALLISAAKQSNVSWVPEKLRTAINSTGDPLSAYGAFEQGNGLFQVGAAWKLLKKGPNPTGITSRAPVNTVLAGDLEDPGHGPGIYQREGWTAGDSKTLTIDFTRRSGRRSDFNLTWVGNDGTFASADSISLPKDSTVPLNVTVHPTTEGAHSAILNVDDPSTDGIDYQVMNTVIAADQFTKANGYTVSHALEADRGDQTRVFFYVPPEATAFRADVTDIQGRVRLHRFDPRGMPVPSGGPQDGGSISRTETSPLPGVWEVSVDNLRTSPLGKATFKITGTVYGVNVNPPSWTIDPTSIGTPYTKDFTFTNNLAAFTGNAAGSDLGSKLTARPNIQNHTQQKFYVTTTPGSTSLVVHIGKAADPGTDLDLYVYDSQGNLVGSSTGSTDTETVIVENPAPDTYGVVVDAYNVPSGSTDYDYSDLFTNPAFGSIAVNDPPAPHPSGDTWMRTVTATALSAPSTGRFLEGPLNVKSGDGVIGQAVITMKNVG